MAAAETTTPRTTDDRLRAAERAGDWCAYCTEIMRAGRRELLVRMVADGDRYGPTPRSVAAAEVLRASTTARELALELSAAGLAEPAILEALAAERLPRGTAKQVRAADAERARVARQEQAILALARALRPLADDDAAVWDARRVTARTVDLGACVEDARTRARASGCPALSCAHGGCVPHSYRYRAGTDVVLVVAGTDGTVLVSASRVRAPSRPYGAEREDAVEVIGADLAVLPEDEVAARLLTAAEAVQA